MSAHLMLNKTIAIVNATGRQAASLIRVASAVGYTVRAQCQSLSGLVAAELSQLPRVMLLPGPLTSPELLQSLFAGAHLAFINTVSFGDELAIGKALALAAKKAGVQHYIYSSMPDHSIFEGRGWEGLPYWSVKFSVEMYVRELGLPATFVYAGIYNNNFTTLPYPLFCLDLVDGDDGETGRKEKGLVWRAPFHEDKKLPWLDAEHDVGPAVLQILKDGPRKWAGHRIALAFELLSPREICRKFGKALGLRCEYVRGPIEIKVKIPDGYREQLEALERLFGEHVAPYFGLGLGGEEGLNEARGLWPGWRGIEEYAGEAFLVEERVNGRKWVDEWGVGGREGLGEEREDHGEEGLEEVNENRMQEDKARTGSEEVFGDGHDSDADAGLQQLLRGKHI